jgi:hypothetical protein
MEGPGVGPRSSAVGTGNSGWGASHRYLQTEGGGGLVQQFAESWLTRRLLADPRRIERLTVASDLTERIVRGKVGAWR